MNILVTGGAGYIGSVAVKKLIEQNNKVIVVDNLSKGKKELVDSKALFYEIDLINLDELKKIFQENKIDAIIHFAAYKAVEESMFNAVKYSDNILGTINLLNLAVEFNAKRFVFSSSAAVYGESNDMLSENAELKPVNYYGFTKLECERIIEWYSKIHGLSYACLRYFNVAGDLLKYIDPEAKNIFPILLDVVKGLRKEFKIFGNDYNTEDGTCVRDYIDVRDLVDAHILALNKFFNGALNLGSGKGYSVKQVVEMFKQEAKIDFKVVFAERRKGDPAKILASNKKAKEILGWKPNYSLKDMVKSTLEAYSP